MIAQDLAAEVMDLARKRGVMVVTVESCTGGMVAAAITDLAGSSAVFERGFVTYSNGAKAEAVGVSRDTLNTFGAVSEETAREMATGALAHSRADFAVSTTGIAGPGGATPGKPVGMVCFAVAGDGRLLSETRQFGDQSREAIRQASVMHALRMLASALGQNSEQV